jgi:hypothetical protein
MSEDADMSGNDQVTSLGAMMIPQVAADNIGLCENWVFCCGRIDPTQAVKATGFNHREHRGHRVFKPILCVPLCSLWLYSLPMLFMSIAVLCIQLTITNN